MIGIGVTTYNRNKIAANTLAQIKAFAPAEAKIVIVDDGSPVPFVGASYRFNVNQGAPTAKNKCLELLEGCEHIFLFDDDCHPVVKGWELPYIEAEAEHLNFTFKYPHVEAKGLKIHTNPNGCMMYISKKALEVVGGFDTKFIKYGYWHGAYANRVYNAGLNAFPFMDVVGSSALFCSMDRDNTVRTASPDRRKYLPKNKQRYLEQINSSEFIPFKSSPRIWYSNPYNSDKNIGKALNEFCELVPDGDWICLQDGDIAYLTPDWGKQIEEVVRLHGSKYSLFGCLTNRLGRPIQRYKKEFSEDHDIRNHAAIARELSASHFAEVEDITDKRYIAGLFMLFPKSLYSRIKFKENCNYFDDEFSRDVVRAGGKLGLLKGLYVYHLYRIWSDTPITEKTHLK